MIYLDHNATSPPSPDHLNSLLGLYQGCMGNPSSPHAQGRRASVALTNVRHCVARILGVDVGEIIFTCSATEANNLGSAGVVGVQNQTKLSDLHAVATAFEHPSIREPLEALSAEGLNVHWCSVSSDGFVSLEDLIRSITPQTTLVCVMAAQNEVGTLQPVKDLGDFLHDLRWAGKHTHSAFIPKRDSLRTLLNPAVTPEHLQKLHFHVDAVQALGRVPTEQWFSPGIDSCSLSGHKLGSIPGVGVFFLRRGRKFKPLFRGGAQEKNRRAGTENLLSCLSLELVLKQMTTTDWWKNLTHLRCTQKAIYEAVSKLPGVFMNTPDHENTLPNTINFSIVTPHLNGEDLLLKLDLAGISVSSGSACSSGANLPSQTLLAMGRTKDYAKNAVRISLSNSELLQKNDFEFLISTLSENLGCCA